MVPLARPAAHLGWGRLPYCYLISYLELVAIPQWILAPTNLVSTRTATILQSSLELRRSPFYPVIVFSKMIFGQRQPTIA